MWTSRPREAEMGENEERGVFKNISPARIIYHTTCIKNHQDSHYYMRIWLSMSAYQQTGLRRSR
jgi:hypothetical protein